jgi:phosphate transport system substrate-binding protein
MNTVTKIAIGIVVIAIVISGVFAGSYMMNSNSSQSSSTPTPTPTPTASPTSSPSASPTVSPTQTTTPTTAPTAAPTVTPTLTPTASPSPAPVSLNGAGATFPVPFLTAVINAYMTANPWATINYQGQGSGAGVSALTAKTVDFAASDAPLTDTQRTAAPNVLHIPETAGAVTLAYNLPGISGGLHLTGDVIAAIYNGTITNWNDAAIANLNTGTTLPNHSITPIYRAESSGTTNVFTSYLSVSSSSWAAAIGHSNSVSWPVGSGVQGNAGVASTVDTTQYTIGYVELAYALQNGMTVASVKNPAGNFVAPSLASTSAAVSAGASGGFPAGDASWTSVSLLNTNAADAYPIVTLTYLLEYKELNTFSGMTQAKAFAIVNFLWYVVHTGQNQAAGQAYASLPANVVTIDEATIRSITFNGQVVYTS